ncbi:hypothetical protein QJS04_geneDACA006354 [Acorus gramineus]|uniref:Uncharacterized protein n=1 Tax=Acorus gramineus TaxID=55184 RepID=A0AAV9AX34_ACOGR|nr:hypothetical protein QJS04_geneDACA006354 [Acorus gramineus]
MGAAAPTRLHLAPPMDTIYIKKNLSQSSPISSWMTYGKINGTFQAMDGLFMRLHARF